MAFRMSEEEFAAYVERKRREAAPTKVRDAPSVGAVKPRADGVSEEEEQITLFEWAGRMAYTWPELQWLYHVPNGGYRSKAEAGRFRAMGVKSGVPDVHLDVPRGPYHGLKIEMKRAHGGKPSDTQSAWIDYYNAIGYRAAVCHGWQEAREVIEEYLKGGNVNGV